MCGRPRKISEASGRSRAQSGQAADAAAADTAPGEAHVLVVGALDGGGALERDLGEWDRSSAPAGNTVSETGQTRQPRIRSRTHKKATTTQNGVGFPQRETQ